MPNGSEENVINKEKPDYLEYYKNCHNNLSNQESINYLTSRGITMATADEFGLGYDDNADPAYAPGGIGEKKYPERRIIIPVSPSYYVPRAIDPDSAFPKPNPSGSSVSIFNSVVLYRPDVHLVFVVEGVFDALTIEQCGYSAIALNSVNAVGQLIKVLENRPTTATLCICLDNDTNESAKKNVEKQVEKLKENLDRLEIKYVVDDITNGHYKDVNEFLQADPEECREAIAKVNDRTQRPDNTVNYIHCFMAGEIAQYKEYVPTGFSKLDADSGGLKIGLYGIPAIPSLGKTTFALQIADQTAAAGHDVIYFSLEMSRLELVSKSLSRITLLQKGKNDGPVTSLQIRNGQTGPIERNDAPIEQNSVSMAIDEYTKTVGNRLSIVEGNFSFSVSSIRKYVKAYIDRNGCHPVVIIDYLQILQPEKVDGHKQATKEAVDMIVTELKQLSRDLLIPVIAILSVNRMNYTTPISYESLKESGSIEFSCDVIWGMQLHCLNEEMFEKDNKTVGKRNKIDEAKKANPREIDLVCLKNRFGKTGLKWLFKYYPAYDLFQEVDTF